MASGTITPMETVGRRKRSFPFPFPESVVVEIIARLPLRSIARFKSVCKQWRSLIESSYFRSLFVSHHRNSSSSWSLMFPYKFQSPITEAIGFHGCETWDLPKSPASYIMPFQQYPNHDYYYYVSASNGLVWIQQIYGSEEARRIKPTSFVGNPVTQECVVIPPPLDPINNPSTLVTRLVNGVVSSFKLISICYDSFDRHHVRNMFVYSSETGRWSFKQLRSPIPLQGYGFRNQLNLDGKVYVWDKTLDDPTGPGVLVAYDFYNEKGDNQFQILPLPGPFNKYVRRCLTTSCGHVIYMEILYQKLKVWKLKKSNNSKSGEWWQLTRAEIDMASVGFDVLCFPLGMNPFDTDLVYLWSRQHRCVASGNLRTQEFTLHRETESWSDDEGKWRINTYYSNKYMQETHELETASVIRLSQYVLPQWMDPVPCPPL